LILAAFVMSHSLRIGTRASPLALWQAQWVADQLRSAGAEVELVHITTQGDVQQRGPIEQLGMGVFTKEIQHALLDERVDLAVHSLKDLPTEPVAGLCLAAVPRRGPVGDVLVSRAGLNFAELPQGAVVGTGSSRRRSQLLHARPNLRIEGIRGNVDTRLRKLQDGQFDAIVLAEAGLERLNLAGHITQILPKSIMLPAVGQGALGLETRERDTATRQIIALVDDPATHQGVLAERALLAALRGGCLAPVGAWGRIEADGQLHLAAVVLSGDGHSRLHVELSAPPADAVELGRRAAEELLAQGAAELIQAARRVQ
jgi:hydroxymethylbilane synthase